MTYREALAWLFGTQLFGIKLGLENIERLLSAVGLPGDQRFIHVAGTNGKGSVCAMIDSILRAQQYRSGLFTSPHLVTFRERIQVDGEMIGEDEVARGLTRIRELVRDWEPHPTFFEIATALGLQHFKEQGCEFVVLETGMGGRLDATNAVRPIVSVITPIDYDHQKWLGNSLGEIAAEKAGIIKPGVPVISSAQLPEAETVIRTHAIDCGAPISFVHEAYEGPLGLKGAHQKTNAAIALASLHAAQIKVSKESVTIGLTSVSWPVRFQKWNERTVIDGAHNPGAARVLARTWRESFGKEKATIILAVLRDKDAAGMVSILASIAECFVLVAARSERALPPDELAAILKEAAPAIPLEFAPSVAAGISKRATGYVLITGSLHFAGEALAQLRGEADSVEDCLQ